MLAALIRHASAFALLGVAFALAACGIAAQPFANGSVVMAGPVAVALMVQPDPPRAGRPGDLQFTLKQNGAPLAADQATVQLFADMPKMTMNLPAIPLQSEGNGQWRAHYTFPMAGGWSATLRVTPKGAGDAQATFTFDVGP